MGWRSGTGYAASRGRPTSRRERQPEHREPPRLGRSADRPRSSRSRAAGRGDRPGSPRRRDQAEWPVQRERVRDPVWQNTRASAPTTYPASGSTRVRCVGPVGPGPRPPAQGHYRYPVAVARPWRPLYVVQDPVPNAMAIGTDHPVHRAEHRPDRPGGAHPVAPTRPWWPGRGGPAVPIQWRPPGCGDSAVVARVWRPRRSAAAGSVWGSRSRRGPAGVGRVEGVSRSLKRWPAGSLRPATTPSVPMGRHEVKARTSSIVGRYRALSASPGFRPPRHDGRHRHP
jgi:hypothetical protein